MFSDGEMTDIFVMKSWLLGGGGGGGAVRSFKLCTLECHLGSKFQARFGDFDQFLRSKQ